MRNKINALATVFKSYNQLVSFKENECLTFRLMNGAVLQEFIKDTALDDFGNSVLDTDALPYLVLEKSTEVTTRLSSYTGYSTNDVLLLKGGNETTRIPFSNIISILVKMDANLETTYITFEFDRAFYVSPVFCATRVITTCRHPFIKYVNNKSMTMNMLLDRLIEWYGIELEEPTLPTEENKVESLENEQVESTDEETEVSTDIVTNDENEEQDQSEETEERIQSEEHRDSDDAEHPNLLAMELPKVDEEEDS